MRDERILVFVEAKLQRGTDFGDPLEVVVTAPRAQEPALDAPHRVSAQEVEKATTKLTQQLRRPRWRPRSLWK